MTEAEAQNIIYRELMRRGNWSFIMPNSYAFGWEADIIAINRKLYVAEFEIKVSHADFLNDARKSKHCVLCNSTDDATATPNYTNYVCPEGLIKANEVPEMWGLWYITEHGRLESVVRAVRRHDKIISSSKMLQMSSALMHRLWNIREQKGSE